MNQNEEETCVVTSVHEYLQVLAEIRPRWGVDDCVFQIWYRGQSRESYSLVPGAYRGDWDEESMFNIFYTDLPCPPHERPTSEWDCYAMAQHYRLPTRLLDWSMDPLCGLFFAVRGDHRDNEQPKWDSSDPPVVWLLEPTSLNIVCQREDSVYVAAEPVSALDHYLPGRGSPELPSAFRPKRTTSRIQAQAGAFTVHGTRKCGIESIWKERHSELSNKRQVHLSKIIVADPESVSRELFALKHNRLKYFPEADSLSDHLRRVFAPAQ